ncbi:hypothetical protein AYY22_16035 [Photobacterium kishitanii]|nr:hypothetical protein AYY22_16035 [Photobacterium kishitanii]
MSGLNNNTIGVNELVALLPTTPTPVFITNNKLIINIINIKKFILEYLILTLYLNPKRKVEKYLYINSININDITLIKYQYVISILNKFIEKGDSSPGKLFEFKRLTNDIVIIKNVKYIYI